MGEVLLIIYFIYIRVAKYTLCDIMSVRKYALLYAPGSPDFYVATSNFYIKFFVPCLSQSYNGFFVFWHALWPNNLRCLLFAFCTV